MPRSTKIVRPVKQEAASETRTTAMRAISAGDQSSFAVKSNVHEKFPYLNSTTINWMRLKLI
jgi:hypothetical protein